MNNQQYLAELTKREKEITQLLIKGSSNSLISSELGISLNTVKTHLKHIYTKLEVQNRQQLIVAVLTN